MNYYAVAKGHQTGIFNTWDECKVNTNGYKGALYKKFSNEADAKQYIESNTQTKSAFDVLITPKSVKKIIEIEESMFIPDYYVYTDGACSNNGQENAMAGIGIYFGENDTRNVSRQIKGKQTNNTAELQAIIQLYNIIKDDIVNKRKICIVSDSEYAIRCATEYGEKHHSKGWKKDIPNKDMVKEVYELYKGLDNVKFVHIMAHTDKIDNHSMGNDGADKLANTAIGLDSCPYAKEKLYLSVPFIKKDIVKGLGGKWDASKKLWYIFDNSDNKEHVLKLFNVIPLAT
jgi:ribonuclease HI